jgi:hypothetical protein
MEMSPEYLKKTAQHLAQKGYELKEEEVDYGTNVDGNTKAQRYTLSRPEICLILECVDHPTEGHRYFLEVSKFHNLTMTSFLLDSWKFFKDRIEFKFYALAETGMGLSFVLRD